MKYFRLCPISSVISVDSGAEVYYRHISGQTMESPNGKLSEEKKNRLSKLEDGIKEQVTLDDIHNSKCSHVPHQGTEIIVPYQGTDSP